MPGKLVAIVTIVSGLVLLGIAIYHISRRLGRRLSGLIREPALEVAVTPTGYALCGLMVLALIVFRAAAALSPESPLGQFVLLPGGQFVAAMAAIAFFTIAGELFACIGYPSFKY